jgi:hypothetical protein
MAKKYCGKAITTKYKKTKILQWMYHNGCIHSTAIHTILFVVLFLIVVKNPVVKPIKISLDFAKQESLEALSLDKLPDIEIKNTKSERDSVADLEKIHLENYTSVEYQPDLADTSESLPLESDYDLTLKDLIKVIDKKKNIKQNDFSVDIKENKEDNLGEILQSISSSIGNGARNSDSSVGLGGLGNDFGKRLEQAGAKSGDIQISIMWNTIDDIDLHVSYTPGNGLVDNINWTNRIGRLSAGILDVDRNANSAMLTNIPVENVFWPKGSAPSGFFTVYIHFYRSWSNNTRVPVIARFKIGEQINEIKAMAILYQSPQEIYRFKHPN